jgi:hypothetical protein
MESIVRARFYVAQSIVVATGNFARTNFVGVFWHDFWEGNVAKGKWQVFDGKTVLVGGLVTSWCFGRGVNAVNNIKVSITAPHDLLTDSVSFKKTMAGGAQGFAFIFNPSRWCIQDGAKWFPF